MSIKIICMGYLSDKELTVQAAPQGLAHGDDQQHGPSTTPAASG